MTKALVFICLTATRLGTAIRPTRFQTISRKKAPNSQLRQTKLSAIPVPKKGGNYIIGKRGKDSSKIKNWMPVSLLNVDYKTLTKTLAKCIEKSLPNDINSDQSCFLKKGV